MTIKQMSMWNVMPQDNQPAGATWQLFIDGASKNNPGPAGSGFVLKKDNVIVERRGFFLGVKTNNQAEYYGLLLGIFFAQQHVPVQEKLTIVSDSLLLVKQMQGLFKVKNMQLAQLKNVAMTQLRGRNCSFEHVLRAYNTLADEMANHGIAHKISVPQAFLDSIKTYGITL